MTLKDLKDDFYLWKFKKKENLFDDRKLLSRFKKVTINYFIQ